MQNKAPLSPSLRIENTVYISGQVGINPQTLKLSNDSFENEAK
ncbi:RidA family protein [Mesonia sp. K4-1]|jgi:2-iminobutanoate/2-iminopropanoate deaminase|nr:RidA family protein [Mesonia sp. K4-1]|tara:strand:+ start:277 stop:405 length:129 start_codon:yes stop_codon:yes gene_type:complete